MAGVVGVIWVWREAEYFCGGDWTGQITLNLLWKIDLSGKIDFLPAPAIYPTCRTEPHRRLLNSARRRRTEEHWPHTRKVFDGLSGPDSFSREVRAEEMIADAANHPRYYGFN
jgi:hypothetical protein